jgi:hypothetical protein
MTDRMHVEAKARGLDHLIHLGAGRCSELEDHLARKPGVVLLVEADPQLAEALAARTADLPEVRVLCAAVAGQPEFRTLHRYNLPDAGSLRPATGLRELYPGLRLLEQLPVELIDPTELLQPLQVDPEGDSLLIIDLPGEELPVLQALQAADLLHSFRELRLYCGRQSLYLESAPAEQVLQWLVDTGFDVADENGAQDSDRPCWTLRRNALMLQNRGLRQQIEALTQERDSLSRSSTELKSQLDQVQLAANEQAQQARDLQAKLKQATDQRDAEKKQVQALGQEIDRITRAFDDKSARADQLAQRVAELEAERAEAELRRDLLDQEMTRAEAQIDLIKDVLLRDSGP